MAAIQHPGSPVFEAIGETAMIDTFKNLDFTQLPVADRFDLIGAIWDSIVDDDKKFDLTDAQKDELRRRKKYHEDHPNEFLTWDDVKSQILDGRVK